MITIAICDDDYKTTQMLRDCVRETALAEQNLEIDILCFTRGEALCQSVEIQQINILLLDIEMPELNGIHTAEQFRKANPDAALIFITGHPGYMRECFHVHTFEFVDKPIDKIRLGKVLVNAFEEVKKKSIFIYSINKKNYPIATREILYFEAEDHEILIYKKDRIISYYDTLSRIAKDPSLPDFLLISKSHIINLNKIKCKSKTEFIMLNGKTLPIGLPFRSVASDAYQKFVERRNFRW